MAEAEGARFLPETFEEVAETVRGSSRLRVVGSDTQSSWRVGEPPDASVLDLSRLAGLVSIETADQVMTVRAGTRLEDLQSELARHDQCLPLGSWPRSGTVGGALAMNLPHTLEGPAGGWKEWLLGLTLVTAQGEIVKTGSRVVKNVAGYDVHKLMLGARGTLGVIVEVTLRTLPARAKPAEKLEGYGDLSTVNLVHRVRRTDVKHAIGHYPDSRWDPETGTIWATVPDDWTFQRFPGDWLLRRGTWGVENEVQRDLMRRTKTIFDPEGRLEAGI